MIPDLHGFGPALIAGTWMTIQLALASLALGLVLGLLGALAKTSPYSALRWLGGTYSTIVRGVPELIWVLLIYFGTINLVRWLGNLVGIDNLALSPSSPAPSPWACASAPMPRKSSAARCWRFPRATAKPAWHWAWASGGSSCA